MAQPFNPQAIADYLARTRQIESAGNDRAVSKTGAAGPFQITRGTGKRLGISPADRFDYAKSAAAATRLAVENANYLQRALGRTPTTAEVYLAHQQGAAGAAAMLKHPDMPAAQALMLAGVKPARAIQAIRVNNGNPNAPAREMTARFINKFEGTTPRGAAQAAPPPQLSSGSATGSVAFKQPSLSPAPAAQPAIVQPLRPATATAAAPALRGGVEAGMSRAQRGQIAADAERQARDARNAFARSGGKLPSPTPVRAAPAAPSQIVNPKIEPTRTTPAAAASSTPKTPMVSATPNTTPASPLRDAARSAYSAAVPPTARLYGELAAGATTPITEKDFAPSDLRQMRDQVRIQKFENLMREGDLRDARAAMPKEDQPLVDQQLKAMADTRGKTSVPYAPGAKESFTQPGLGRAIDRSYNDPAYRVGMTLGRYNAYDTPQGTVVLDNYNFNRGAQKQDAPTLGMAMSDPVRALRQAAPSNASRPVAINIDKPGSYTYTGPKITTPGAALPREETMTPKGGPSPATPPKVDVPAPPSDAPPPSMVARAPGGAMSFAPPSMPSASNIFAHLNPIASARAAEAAPVGSPAASPEQIGRPVLNPMDTLLNQNPSVERRLTSDMLRPPVKQLDPSSIGRPGVSMPGPTGIKGFGAPGEYVPGMAREMVAPGNASLQPYQPLASADYARQLQLPPIEIGRPPGGDPNAPPYQPLTPQLAPNVGPFNPDTPAPMVTPLTQETAPAVTPETYADPGQTFSPAEAEGPPMPMDLSGGQGDVSSGAGAAGGMLDGLAEALSNLGGGGDGGAGAQAPVQAASAGPSPLAIPDFPQLGPMFAAGLAQRGALTNQAPAAPSQLAGLFSLKPIGQAGMAQMPDTGMANTPLKRLFT